MFRLPIYKRGDVYTLHTRIRDKQVKISLRTNDRLLAASRAIQILTAMNFDDDLPLPAGFEHLAKSPTRRWEMDMQRGIFKADGPDDHARLMEAMAAFKEVQAARPAPAPSPAPVPPVVVIHEPKNKGGRFTVLKLFEVFVLSKELKESSKYEFRISAREFSEHVNSRQLHQITHNDIATFIAALKTRGNSASTVDKKVGNIRTMINFAIKQRTFEGENVAAEKNLLSKEQRNNRGQKAQEINDLVALFNRPEYRECRQSNPAYFYINTLAILTGMRVSPIARLTAQDFKVTVDDVPYIDVDKDKTPSSRRNVCLPTGFHAEVKKFLEDNNGFGLTGREASGKGFSDSVRKIHLDYLKEVEYQGRAFTSHSYRKTFNQYMDDEGVPLEIRSQVLGHKLQHVNVEVYLQRRKPMKVVADAVMPLQTKLLAYLGLVASECNETSKA